MKFIANKYQNCQLTSPTFLTAPLHSNKLSLSTSKEPSPTALHIFIYMQQSHPLWKKFHSPRYSSPNRHTQPRFKINKADGVWDKSERIVVTGREQINRYVQVSTWRSKTSLPILKVEQLKVFLQGEFLTPDSIFTLRLLHNNQASNKSISQQTARQLLQFTSTRPHQSRYRVTVKVEDVEVRLSDIQKLSFPQIIHLLKEMLVGYEVLIDIFGFFIPTSRMIGVNSSHHWKIWINEDFKLNQSRPAQINTRQFIHHLFIIAENHSLSTVHARQFFSYIYQQINQQNSTFLSIIQKVHEFARFNKILPVSMVTLPKQIQRQPKPSSGVRIKTDHSIMTISPDKNQQARNKTPDLLAGYGSPHCHFMNTMKPSTKTSHLSHLGTNNNNWAFNSVQINRKIISKQKDNKIRPSSTLTQEGFKFSQNTKISPQSFCIDRKIHLNNIQISKAINSYRHSKDETTSFYSPRSTAHPYDKKQPMTPKTINVKSTEHIPVQSLPNLPHDLTDNQISITFSRKNSIKMENDSLSSMKRQSPNKPNSRTSWFSINCQSPNHSSSTKQLRNSSEMQPDITSYAKLKEKDLKQRIRNNHSVINNAWKPQQQKHEGQEKKNLTVSHQFHNRQPHNLGKKDETKDQWISTITGLFDDTRTIKLLKESVQLKGKDEEVFEKEYLKNVKLDLLEQFGRIVENIVEDDNPAPRKRKYTENMESMQLIEEECDDMKSLLQTDRKDEDGPIKVPHESEDKSQKNIADLGG